jgi:hypothetical protein
MESIKVAIRIKPEDTVASRSHQETEKGRKEKDSLSLSQSCIKIEGNQLTADAGGKPTRDALSFSFDRIFSYTSTQDEVFDDCRYLVDAAVDGFNSTVFAFGMTGSGKT